jgi:transposase
MHLSDHDLRQLDEADLETLSEERARALLVKALADLKTARERLGQNPSNSSRPPSTRAPWEQSWEDTQETEKEAPSSPARDDEKTSSAANSEEDSPAKQRKMSHDSSSKPGKPGRPKGAPGHSRTQQLPVDAEHTHAPDCCAVCDAPLNEFHQSRAHNARYEIDLIQPGAGSTGLVLEQTKHIWSVVAPAGIGRTPSPDAVAMRPSGAWS